MTYTVNLVGSDKKKRLSAATPTDAAAAFGREVALPQSGWIFVEGSDGTTKQFSVRNAAVCEDDKVLVQAADVLPIKTDVSSSALAFTFVILGVLDFIAGGVGLFLGNTLLATAGLSGGLVLLALAKVIACLHEGVQRLASIQEMLASRKE